MTWSLRRPSFWPEPRDPWAWQRALRTLAAASCVPDPRPCWEQILRGSLSRRSVPGLYGMRATPAPPVILGVGLLEHGDRGWQPSPCAAELLELDRDAFQAALAATLVRRSAWVRLALVELAAGRWIIPVTAHLRTQRQVRVGYELLVPDDALAMLPDAAQLLGELDAEQVDDIETTARIDTLAALHAPLYLLHAIGWLDDGGRPDLPDALMAGLGLESVAVTLRRIAAEEQDASGFAPIARIAERLRSAVATGNGRSEDLAAWTDRVLGSAIEAGTIEVHAWAPGQPRHGRGLYGDRDRKLVRLTVHDDLQLTARATRRTEEGDR